MGPVAGNRPGIEGWNLQPHAQTSGRGEGLGVGSIASGQRLNQTACAVKPPQKPRRMGLESFGLVSMWRCGERGAGEGAEAPPRTSSTWLVLSPILLG